MAWACLLMMLAYLAAPVLHSWGVADHTHLWHDGHGAPSQGHRSHVHTSERGSQNHASDVASQLCSHHADEAVDVCPDGERQSPVPHDESKCQVCLTVSLTQGGANLPVEPAFAVLHDLECVAAEVGHEMPPTRMAMLVRSSRGPPGDE